MHTQNGTLCEFLCQEPDVPVSLNIVGNELTSLLRLSRDEIYQQLSAFNPDESARKTSYDSDKLLISTVDIAKASMCPMSDISGHLLRVVSQLWKVIVSGTATSEADLAWANPAAILPLRVQAFATLLHLLGSSTLYLSKRGATQLDGSGKWNMMSLSRVVALLFDEGAMFGSQAEEPFCKEFYATPETVSAKQASAAKTEKAKKEKRRKHVRSNFEFYNKGMDAEGPGLESLGSNVEDSLAGDLSTFSNRSNTIGSGSTWLSTSSSLSTASSSSVTTKSDDGVKTKNGSIPPLPTGKSYGLSNGSLDPVRIDSMFDFRRALKTGSEEADNEDALCEGSSSGSRAAMAMIKAFSGSTGTNRRWMTAPASGLPTIREDSPRDEAELNETKGDKVHNRQAIGPLDSLDSEIVLLRPQSSKQMRVPNLGKNITSSGDSDVQESKEDSDDGLLGPFPNSVSDSEKTEFPGDISQGLSLMYVSSLGSD